MSTNQALIKLPGRSREAEVSGIDKCITACEGSQQGQWTGRDKTTPVIISAEKRTMSYKMNEKQFAAVLALPAKERYGHFISRVADWEEAWGLRSGDGWSLAGDKDKAAFPLWPHEQYAKACATGEWSDAVPEAIDLEDMMLLLNKLEEQGLLVAVFPTPQGQGVVVSPGDLRQHLDAELQQYD